MELKKTTQANTHKIKPLLFLFLLVAFICNAQIMQVKIVGGAPISSNEVITIEAGKSVPFKIINSEPFNCRSINIRKIELSGSSGSSSFSISLPETFGNILRVGCNDQIATYLDFTVIRDDLLCTEEEVTITIFFNVNEEFTFKLRIKKSPIISVLGGSPPADIIDGTPTTTANNGTFFGIVEQGASVTRRFYVVNTGSCPLVLNSISSSIQSPNTISNFTIITATSPNPPFVYPIPPGEAFWFDVTFNAPSDGTGLYMETINIINNTSAPTNLFTFNVSAEIYDFSPGPGGVRADFRLWLKSTRGVIASPTTPSYVSVWRDLGTDGKSATQSVAANQPTYLDNAASNINFNPVIKFENNVGGLEQYLYNDTNGFYSQDIFIVMIPDPAIDNLSNQNAIFAGVKSNLDSPTPGGTITGIGMGKYTESFDNEVITYMQESNASYGIAEVSITKTYNNAGIINVHNNIPATAQELLYNSYFIETSTTNSELFANVGHTELDSDNNTVILGTKYWIGKNFSELGSLNGRVAEIMTFAQRVPDEDRPKIETYLAIKYGITLGAAAEAKKNYVNSLGEIIWDITTDTQYNYNIAGIGRDDNSDLNQKQSKSINDTYEVTIGLGGIYSKNMENTNEFENNKDFLVWGCNNLEFTGACANTVTIATEITTSLIRIDRKWKIVESGGDVENIYIGIPSAAFTDAGFNLSTIVNEEYVLIISDTKDFNNEDIIDVIPLKASGTNWQTWYDFDGTKYFTFGKAPKLTGNRSINIKTGDYLVGEYALNININAFTISAWIRSVPASAGADPRTIMAKGSKLQLRLNSDNKIEVVLEDVIIFTSTPEMALDDSKWHQITFVYESGTIFLYIDGILDKSVQGVNPPTPNYNHFSLGALFVSKGSGISNPILGEIDEVYVWDQGLTQDQIRYLMNQEIERFDVGDTDYANGKVLPQAAESNEVTTIPWSKLRAYYDFNSFYGSTVEGLTNDRNFLRIKYLKKDKQIVEDQTAPLPYVSAADAVANPLPVWGDETTWVNGAAQNPPNSKGLDGSTYIDWNIVETSHDITSGDRDDIGITVLGLISTAGTLTIANPNETLDETNSGYGLRVTHYLELDGIIDLVGESQLLQDEGSILDADSGGYIERDQQGTANSFNYNYWSSSVGPVLVDTNTKNSRGTGIASTNAPFTIKGIINDGRSASPTPTPPPPGILSILYGTSPYAADKVPGAQLTISNYWLYQFYGKDDDYNSWFPRINENSPLAPGAGYTMKGSSGKVQIIDQQNYVFRGKPYNGDISLELKNSDGIQRDRLIGNPYPSALDANEFILDHIKKTEIINGEGGRNDVNVFNGALYFWDHFGYINSHNLGAYVGGYATYTLMGGAQAIADDARINTNSCLTSSKVPERYIPVGQGFFVITALPSNISGTTTSVEGGKVIFKNSQRYFKREGSSSTETPNIGSVFMKNSNSKTVQSLGGKETTETYEEVDLRPKIRLLFHSPKGYNRQLLIGADENTTNNFDIGYDGLIADTGPEDMFWMIQDAKFVIQGVPKFNTDQEFPLGIKIAKGGLATIKIDALENMDENLSLHIKDKLTGETHNISQNPFEINLEAGTYLDRFSLIFKMQKLVNEDVKAEVLIPAAAQPIIEGIHVFMNNATGELQIKNNSPEEILSVALVNTLGQTVKTWNSNFNIRTISLPLSMATGIYFVQINTKAGKTVKKISV